MVELLIAIGVMAILAGIAVVGYGAWRQSATEKALTSDLKTALAAMEQEKNFKGSYPSSLPSSYKSNSTNIAVYVTPGSSTSPAVVCLEAASTNPAIKMHIRSSDQKVASGAC